ncbi:RNA polymerase, sigma-24 subunit, ECF subfamily [Fibrisoma limi BUZ 3]|uniref:RNA polymerase, sigma-24 subunit, ECF subfamily n=1 Tax=Fibrisoma limi BUZ 3 TaxID=1185876 RepID=I2GPP3_9BACT|nr:sigma-70 family RNA polymerase sigma factor [Fibrisoma limi]CCH55871.1 RNA polymerase, sigma-24 subunit, ECF subfamily [Fibrisoma limi BUZ 3]
MNRNLSLHASASDKALWQQTLSGDKTAFGQLYVRFYPALKRYALRLTNDAELVEDTIQDLFLTIWQSRQTLNAKAPAGYYLANALRHSIVRRLNKQQMSSEVTHEMHPMCPSSEEDYVNVEEEQLQVALIERALRTLPRRQQQMVQLYFFEAKTYSEIRQIMQISPQSVYNVLFRSLKALRADYRIRISTKR